MTITANELREVLKTIKRYKDFTILDNPIPFNEMFKDQNIPVVQLHSTQTYDTPEGKDIVGFCGAFTWKNNKLTPLDHDIYNTNTKVLGYNWWSNDKVEKGLDILVGNDW